MMKSAILDLVATISTPLCEYTSFVTLCSIIKLSSFDFGTGHYTQVVWADTEELGCGLVYYKVQRKAIPLRFSPI